ncbi:alpha,alpha-trehalose-phosphate synthase (UDP-forming) [Geminicoccus harenae]|uniref:alpha,alpha-trehalose-phosphate synthase (UDP-forming) n=1 Tax=Geminicoccus harenae TaxID=2498453 RepID=UPI001C96535A|nr:trehalose-6-phosphate synthase [Geminicoccus harenae]
MARLVIVSNRVSVPSGRRVEAGGLTVVLRDGLRKADGLWFGWSGEFADKPGPAKVTTRGRMSYALLDLNQADYRGFYYGFANGSLWPLFHYRLGLVDWKAEHYRAYRKVNAQFAAELFTLLKPDDHVWVHDYQLIPLGEELRKLGFKGVIGFYLHVPFPSGDIVEVLPAHAELGRSLLDYDLIGVQTDRSHHDLLDFLERWCGAERDGDTLIHEGHRIATGVYRAAIDTAGFAKEAAASYQTAEVRNLEESLGGRTLMLGVERLDYTKGLPLRFAAYEHLLAHYEEWLHEVVMLQIAPVSRGELAQYRALRSDLERATGRIAGRFASPDWNPIRYVNQPVPRKVLAGFLRVAQVGLVTPLRDGMNLVAKEYVAAQDPDDPGVLVLSRFAGAVEELGDGALLVNPLDIEQTALAMRDALGMPKDERIERWRRCLEPLQTWTARTWYDAFVHKLDEVAKAKGELPHAA